MTEFVLYRFFDANDHLLYIGITINFGGRMAKHAKLKTWWGEVARIEIERLPDLESLRIAERKAIMAETPRHNIRMNVSAGVRVGSIKAPAIESDGRGLVGKWFHSYVVPELGQDLTHCKIDSDGNVLQWQGEIVGRDGDLLLCQLYSWADGCPTHQKLIEPDDMLLWRIYDSNQDMLCAGGCPEASNGDGRVCGRPVTHVIRSEALGQIYRCGRCIEYYAGRAVEL